MGSPLSTLKMAKTLALLLLAVGTYGQQIKSKCMQADSRLDTQKYIDLRLYLNRQASKSTLSCTKLICPTCKRLLWPLESPSLRLKVHHQENVSGTQDTTFGYLEIAWTSVKIKNLWTSWPTRFALTMLTHVNHQLPLVVFHGKNMTLIVEIRFLP